MGRVSSLGVALVALLVSIQAVLAAPSHGGHGGHGGWWKYEGRGSCSPWRVSVRKEWGDLPKRDRREYIRSVKCLMKKPSRIPAGQAPGARSRYDDFGATHINYTLHIHNSGIFPSWHRHFTWLFEQSLQKECGYRGAIPYWNWALSAADLYSSPVFDGSETSLSGDGDYNATNDPMIFGTPFPVIGKGGGPVTNGPFANLISPFKYFVAHDLLEWNGVLPSDSLDAHPHPLRRDLNNWISSQWLTQDVVDYGIYQSPNISDLQNWWIGDIFANVPGPHSAGHLSIGKDMGDFFAAPSDPLFFVHHAMVDLTWTKWQQRDPANRTYALSGGSTTLNIPPSPDVTVDDLVYFGYLDKPQRIGDLMDVKKGRYCYDYDY